MNAVPKMNVVRDRKYLDWLHTQPCIITGQYGNEHETIDPAHIGALGTGIKRSDAEVLPVLHRFHGAGHNGGEVTMWRENLPDYVLLMALRALGREMYADYQRTQAVSAQRPNRKG